MAPMTTSISVNAGQLQLPSARRHEVVERKGLGHPDTIADLVADQFSFLYSRYCLTTFDQVLNHAIDKLTLVGAATRVRMGGFEVIEPVNILLIGNVTPSVASTRIPINDIFHEAVESVMSFCLGDASILRHTNLITYNTFSSAADRSRNFYLPDSMSQAREIMNGERHSNDTVFCTGFASPTPLEELAVELELAVTSPRSRPQWPSVGTDVKVLALRRGDGIDVTMCIPVHPGAATTKQQYEMALGPVREKLAGLMCARGFSAANLTVNTKDGLGGMYLAPFGSSLGKSDCGAVGRGNRHQGFISAFRPVNIEAPSGKNPLHHAGRLYTIAAQRIADAIARTCRVNAEVTIVARNGDPLTHPQAVSIELDDDGHTEVVRGIAGAVINGLIEISNELVVTDPLIAYMAAVDHHAAAFPAPPIKEATRAAG
jgi:S-adenosylmethionine synthetase